MPILSTFGAASARGFKSSKKTILPYLLASVTGGGNFAPGINTKNAWIFLNSGTLVVTNPSTVKLVMVSGGNTAPNMYPYGYPCDGGHGGNIYTNNSLYLATGTYTITVGGTSGTSSAFGYSVSAPSQNTTHSPGYAGNGGNSYSGSGQPGYFRNNGGLLSNSFNCGTGDNECPNLYWNQGGQGAVGLNFSIISSFNPVVLLLGNGGGGGSVDSGGEGGGNWVGGSAGGGYGGTQNGFYLSSDVYVTCDCGDEAGQSFPYGVAYGSPYDGTNAYAGYDAEQRFVYAGSGGGGSPANDSNGSGSGIGASGAVIIYQEL